MQLLLRRSQRDDGWFESAITFILDARLELSPDEQQLFERYGLHEAVVYDSDDRTAHAEAAEEHANKATETPIFTTDLMAQLSGFWSGISSLGEALLMKLSLRVTLGSLIDGQNVEAQDLQVILDVEAAIIASCQYLADYLDLTLTFNQSETLHEF